MTHYKPETLERIMADINAAHALAGKSDDDLLFELEALLPRTKQAERLIGELSNRLCTREMDLATYRAEEYFGKDAKKIDLG